MRERSEKHHAIVIMSDLRLADLAGYVGSGHTAPCLRSAESNARHALPGSPGP